MASGATIVVLPCIRIERLGIDLGRQTLLPSSDRRNVVVLWRELERRYSEAVAEAFGRGR